MAEMDRFLQPPRSDVYNLISPHSQPPTMNNADSSPFTPRTQTLGLVVSLLVCFTAAALGSIATSTSVNSWYQQLVRPSWNPPDWIFGPVWTTLFAMMAVAAWLVWRQAGLRSAAWPLGVFVIQLALNTLWSVLFFGLRRPDLAAPEIVVLWLAIAATIGAFWRRSLPAALLLVPYLAWVTFASILNFTIVRLNS
jgi:benzodiazapine receptor